MSIANNKNNNIGTLHLLGALFVMYGHHCVLIGKDIPAIFATALQKIGLNAIFLISGYLITKSMWTSKGGKLKSAIIYSLKRLGRIYPELFICLILSAYLIGPIFSNVSLQEYFGSPEVSEYIISNLLLMARYNLPGMFQQNPYAGAVNGSLWTIVVEIMLYIVVLIIFLMKRKIRKVIYLFLTCMMCIGSLFCFVVFPQSRLVLFGIEWVSTLKITPYFLIGGSVYLYESQIKKYLNVQIGVCVTFYLCRRELWICSN